MRQTAQRHWRSWVGLLVVLAAAGLGAWWWMSPEAAGQAEYAPSPLHGTAPGQLRTPFLGPQTCAQCHSGFAEYAQWEQWSGSMMANSIRDPLVRTVLAIANQDKPGAGTFCLRCHAPVGFLRGNAEPPDASRLQEIDWEGVQCEVCHRATPAGKIGNAQYVLDDDRNIFGPYDDPFSMPMQMMVGLNPRGSPFVRQGELCGTCHDVTNPLNGFPEQRTYTEWKQSAFAREGITCQSCHMKNLAEPGWASAQTAMMGGGGMGGMMRGMMGNVQQRAHFPQHQFAGGNAWMLDVLALLYPERKAAYARTKEWVLEKLQEEAAELELTVKRAEDSRLVAQVKVINKAGHKLPTGYPEGRRIWLHVVAKDAAGRVLFESGRYDPQTAELSQDPQLKVYGIQAGIKARGPAPTFHLVLNDTILKDNRIPPRGFRPTPDTAPVGASYPPGQHWDVTEYAIDLPSGVRGKVTVTATLYYQTALKEYLEFVTRENRTDDWGRRLYEAWEKTGRSAPIQMARGTATLAVR